MLCIAKITLIFQNFMCAKRFQKIPSSLASPYPLTPLRWPVTAADGDRGGRRKKIWAPP